MPADYKPFDKQEWLRLEKKANDLRHLTVKTVAWGGSGHIGGGMSALDALTILYHRFMKLDPKDPDWADRDRFVLSKGHAAIAYAPEFAAATSRPDPSVTDCPWRSALHWPGGRTRKTTWSTV